MITLKDVQRGELKEVVITVRVTLTQKRWLDENRIRPSLIMQEAIKKLMQNSLGGVF